MRTPTAHGATLARLFLIVLLLHGPAVVSGAAAVDSLVTALRAGPDRAADARTGSFVWTWTDDHGREHYTRVLVPRGYDPSRPLPVFVYLHGNVNRDAPRADDTWWAQPERLAFDDRIVAFPAGWAEARWWQDVKVRHLDALLLWLRTTYNVDENRCHLGGISDGGTGTWYQALRAPTAWAGFLPFIGHPSVLNSAREFADGEVHPANLARESFFVISGRNDRKYPTASLEPYLDLFEAAGARIAHVAHDGGHDVRNWAQQWRAMEDFLAAAPRDPDPDHVVWRTDDVFATPGAYNVIVDELGATADDERFPRFSVIEEGEGDARRSVLAFVRERPSGQVDVRRAGGTYRVRSEFVRRYRVLVSVDVAASVDRIRLDHAGRTLLDLPSRIDPATVLYWDRIRRDRTRLVALEIAVDVAGRRAEARVHDR